MPRKFSVQRFRSERHYQPPAEEFIQLSGINLVSYPPSNLKKILGKKRNQESGQSDRGTKSKGMSMGVVNQNICTLHVCATIDHDLQLILNYSILCC